LGNCFGVLKCNATGDFYFGEIHHSAAGCRPHGKGILLKQQLGRVYESTWTEGKISIERKCIYRDGVVYEGQFRDDSRYGTGLNIGTNGIVAFGQWLSDMMMSGTEYFPNGDILLHGNCNFYLDGFEYSHVM